MGLSSSKAADAHANPTLMSIESGSAGLVPLANHTLTFGAESLSWCLSADGSKLETLAFADLLGCSVGEKTLTLHTFRRKGGHRRHRDVVVHPRRPFVRWHAQARPLARPGPPWPAPKLHRRLPYPLTP